MKRTRRLALALPALSATVLLPISAAAQISIPCPTATELAAKAYERIKKAPSLTLAHDRKHAFWDLVSHVSACDPVSRMAETLKSMGYAVDSTPPVETIAPVLSSGGKLQLPPECTLNGQNLCTVVVNTGSGGKSAGRWVRLEPATTPYRADAPLKWQELKGEQLSDTASQLDKLLITPGTVNLQRLKIEESKKMQSGR